MQAFAREERERERERERVEKSLSASFITKSAFVLFCMMTRDQTEGEREDTICMSAQLRKIQKRLFA